MRTVLIFTFLLFCRYSVAENITATVIEVYDGDTFFINIPDVHPTLGNRLSVRVKGIDCPELRSSNNHEKELGKEAARVAKKKLLYKTVTLTDITRDKYFRLNATVRIEPTGENFGKFMLDNGYAKPYNGGTKPTWNRRFWQWKRL